MARCTTWPLPRCRSVDHDHERRGAAAARQSGSVAQIRRTLSASAWLRSHTVLIVCLFLNPYTVVGLGAGLPEWQAEKNATAESTIERRRAYSGRKCSVSFAAAEVRQRVDQARHFWCGHRSGQITCSEKKA